MSTSLWTAAVRDEAKWPVGKGARGSALHTPVGSQAIVVSYKHLPHGLHGSFSRCEASPEIGDIGDVLLVFLAENN